MPRAEVEAFLASKAASASDEVADMWQELERLYNRKLWHQLTIKLQQNIKDPQFSSNVGLIELYHSFIADFADRIKPLAHVTFALSVIQQITEPAEALEFLEPLQKKAEGFEDAKVTLDTARAELLMRSGKLDETKELLAKCEDALRAIGGVSIMHATYYRVAAEYRKILGKFAEFYSDALRYLGCIELADLPVEMQVVYAYDLCLAALLADGVYNFGELLAHPIINVLRGTEKEWMVELVFAFNSGDIAKYEALTPKWSSSEDLQQRQASLREKISLQALMEVVFRRPSKERNVPFAAIAQASKVAPDAVELLVMKALSLGLVKGSIDEVDQVAHLHWVQPRVLDLDQLGKIKGNLKSWSSSVQVAATEYEAGAPELFRQ